MSEADVRATIPVEEDGHALEGAEQAPHTNHQPESHNGKPALENGAGSLAVAEAVYPAASSKLATGEESVAGEVNGGHKPGAAAGLAEIAVEVRENGLTGVINPNRLVDPENPRSLAEYDIDLPYLEEDMSTSEATDRTKEVFALSRNPETYFEVDVKSSVTREDWKRVTPKGVWELAEQEADALVQEAVENDRDEVIVRMGSTFEGGGVAKLVPPFIHYLNLKGAEATANGSPRTIEAHWLVGREDPRFSTTKRLHNIQQGMLPEDEWFTDANKEAHQQLGEETFEDFVQMDVFQRATKYIIDDFQYAHMLPKLLEYRDKYNPDAKIYIRNHINTNRDMMATEGNARHDVKEYLHEVCRVKDVDGYWAHPVPEFIPDDAPNVTKMQPPLDHFEDLMRGNTEEDTEDKLAWTDRQIIRQNHYRQSQWTELYNDLYGEGNWPEEWAHVDDIEPLDWSRPIELGHARFDWAKNQHLNMELAKRVTDVLHDWEVPEEMIPIWPIFGNGATDDSDRKRVLERMHWFVRNKYAEYKQYIAVAGMEHDYFAENVQVDQSDMVIHLAAAEGWEQVPSQGILNRRIDKNGEEVPVPVPAVVSDGGGLPHQIEDGVTGIVIRHIHQAVPGYENADEYVPKGSELDEEMNRAAIIIATDIVNKQAKQALRQRTLERGQEWHAVEGLTVANFVRIGRAMNGKVDGLWLMSDIAKKEGVELTPNAR